MMTYDLTDGVTGYNERPYSVQQVDDGMELTYATGDKVVHLGRGRPGMNFPAISQVDAYWEALRDGRLMPKRAEVDPRGLESALEFAFILERIAPGVGRFRIAGMHLNDLLGMEVRGMPLTAMFEPGARDKVQETLLSVTDVPKMADLMLSSDRGIGRPGLKARMWLAPLATDTGGPPRVLGCLQSIGQIGRAPRRFAVDQVHTRRIVATRGGATAPELVEPARAPRPRAKAFAEPTASFKPAPKSGAAHLRLVKNE